MKPNAVMSAVVGVVILGAGGGVLFGISLVLPMLVKTLGPNLTASVIAAPILIFFAYLVGNGFLELKSAQASHEVKPKRVT